MIDKLKSVGILNHIETNLLWLFKEISLMVSYLIPLVVSGVSHVSVLGPTKLYSY